ncbi:MAG: beta-galactosidase [Victivallaceae bacterium]|nr:beta-galactosidase [Victivallaceae bacterium]
MIQAVAFDRMFFRNGAEICGFVSGEFHYFRVPKAQWRTRMRLLKETGATALATYVPWRLHEPEEGVGCVDTGDGFHDLSDFLTMAREESLAVVVRPGPYVYSEIVADGLPDWLLKKYPQVLARRKDGSIIHEATVSYLHPLFLEKTRAWYKRILPWIAPHLISQGGAVILFQLDNESAGVQVWRGSLDYHPEMLELGEANGRYARFLKRKFCCIEMVNQRYGTAWSDLTEVDPRISLRGRAHAYLMEQDYGDFYCETLQEFMHTLADYAAENGIDVPFCHNAGNVGLTAYFRETLSGAFPQPFLLGCDHYWQLDQTWPQNQPTPQKLVENFLSCEMLRLLGEPPWIAEFQNGSIGQWPPVTAEDLNCSLRAHLAFGMRGFNSYIFTGGPNPPDFCWSCRDYDYGAPVGADGSLRPTFQVLKDFGALLKQHPGLLASTLVGDFAILMPWELFRPGAEEGPFETDFMAKTQWKSLFLRGVLSTTFAAGLIPELWTEEEPLEKIPNRLLCVMSDQVMPQSRQRRLVEHLVRGGRLLLLGRMPEYDENLNACRILSEACGMLRSTGKIPGEQRFLDFGGAEIVFFSGPCFGMDAIPEYAEELAREPGSGTVCAVGMPVGEHGGRLTLSGGVFSMIRNSHAQYFRYLFEKSGGISAAKKDNPWVLMTRRNLPDGKCVCFLMNASASRQSVRVEISGRNFVRELAPMSVQIFDEADGTELS